MIDYLGLIATVGKVERRDLAIAAMTRDLKILADDLGTTLLLLHQLNRQSAQRLDKRPMLADLRDSGTVEQDAFAVLGVYTPSVDDPHDPRAGESDIRVLKPARPRRLRHRRLASPPRPLRRPRPMTTTPPATVDRDRHATGRRAPRQSSLGASREHRRPLGLLGRQARGHQQVTGDGGRDQRMSPCRRPGGVLPLARASPTPLNDTE